MAEESKDSKEAEGFLIPEVPEELGLDPLLVALLHCAAFLDFADDETVDPDAAAATLETIGYYVQRLPPERLAQVSEQLKKLDVHAAAKKWPEELREFVGEFLYNCGVGEDKQNEE